ncbi:MAG: hypothetical protein DMG21_10810, partial [Acidobacteria bacterium]
MAYYGTPSRPGQLEYDFTVAPGADPNAIRLEIETGNSKFETRRSQIKNLKSRIKIAANGELVIQTGSGEVRFRKPVVYQDQWQVVSGKTQAPDGNHQSPIGNRQLLDGHYVLLARNRVGFKIPKYDKSRPLIIDPVLAYSTYLGG